MVMLSAFSRPSSRGIIAIRLDEGDELIGVKPIHGGEQVVVATKNGYAIRFPETEVRVMGRNARGVKSITFRKDDDEIVGMEVFSKAVPEDELAEDAEVIDVEAAEIELEDAELEELEEIEDDEADDEADDQDETEDEATEEDHDSYEYDGTLLTVSTLGFGKKTDIKNYRVTRRGGKGVINLRIMKKTGKVLSIKRMFKGDELMIVTTNGKVVRLNADTIRSTGRAASGVKLITLDNDDKLISVVRIPSKEEKAD